MSKRLHDLTIPEQLLVLDILNQKCPREERLWNILDLSEISTKLSFSKVLRKTPGTSSLSQRGLGDFDTKEEVKKRIRDTNQNDFKQEQEVLDEIEEKLELLGQGYPLDYLLSEIDFLNLKVTIQEGVFIPRPETEEWVKLVQNSKFKIQNDELKTPPNSPLLRGMSPSGDRGLMAQTNTENVAFADKIPPSPLERGNGTFELASSSNPPAFQATPLDRGEPLPNPQQATLSVFGPPENPEGGSGEVELVDASIPPSPLERGSSTLNSTENFELPSSPSSLEGGGPGQVGRMSKTQINSKNVALADFPTLLVDLCCGSGVIGLSLAKLFDQVILIDSSALAMENARLNAKKNGIENIQFVQSDLLSHPASREMIENCKQWTLVCNPPYVPNSDQSNIKQNRLEYEPIEAIFSGSDGLKAFGQIVIQLQALPLPGQAYFELDPRNIWQAQQMLSKIFARTEVWTDRAGLDRVLVGFGR